MKSLQDAAGAEATQFKNSAEYAQGKLESFFPDKKKIKSKTNDYERGL